ncbi:hypothetical protein ILUMI_13577, partial [Ignelater luminosus]
LVREFRQAFSLVPLTEFVIDGPLVCAELLAVFERLCQCLWLVVMSVLSNSSETCYSIRLCHPSTFFPLHPSELITNEPMAVADAVYFSSWYSHHLPSLKVPLLLIMQRSQKEITITGEGLVTLNAGTIVKVLKVVWSVYSMVRGLPQN